MPKKYGYVETSAVAATHGDGHIYSCVFEDGILENGMLVELKDMIDVENYEVAKPAKGSKVVLISTPAIIYDQTTTAGQAEWNFYVPEGAPARAYSLIETDRFAVADYMVKTVADEGKPAVKGNYLVATTEGTYEEVAAEGFSADEYGFVAQIVEIEFKSNLTIYRVVVKKNSAVAVKSGGEA